MITPTTKMGVDTLAQQYRTAVAALVSWLASDLEAPFHGADLVELHCGLGGESRATEFDLVFVNHAPLTES